MVPIYMPPRRSDSANTTKLGLRSVPGAPANFASKTIGSLGVSGGIRFAHRRTLLEASSRNSSQVLRVEVAFFDSVKSHLFGPSHCEGGLYAACRPSFRCGRSGSLIDAHDGNA